MRKRKGLSSAEVLYKNTNKNRQTFSQLNSERWIEKINHHLSPINYI